MEGEGRGRGRRGRSGSGWRGFCQMGGQSQRDRGMKFAKAGAARVHEPRPGEADPNQISGLALSDTCCNWEPCVTLAVEEPAIIRATKIGWFSACTVGADEVRRREGERWEKAVGEKGMGRDKFEANNAAPSSGKRWTAKWEWPPKESTPEYDLLEPQPAGPWIKYWYKGQGGVVHVWVQGRAWWDGRKIGTVTRPDWLISPEPGPPRKLPLVHFCQATERKQARPTGISSHGRPPNPFCFEGPARKYGLAGLT